MPVAVVQFVIFKPSHFLRSDSMPKSLASIAIVALISCGLSAQTTPHKRATTAKRTPAAAATSGNPVAVIDTTAGKMRCTLFEKQTPETVANFIGLATGTKDWKNPASGASRSEEHTSELQSQSNLVCRLLLEKKKKKKKHNYKIQ